MSQCRAKIYRLARAPIEDPDQHAHPRSLKTPCSSPASPILLFNSLVWPGNHCMIDLFLQPLYPISLSRQFEKHPEVLYM